MWWPLYYFIYEVTVLYIVNSLLPKSFSYSYRYLKECPTVNIDFEGSGESLIIVFKYLSKLDLGYISRNCLGIFMLINTAYVYLSS